jgi:uncharacterized damage-inducible protein DinB
MRMIRALCPVVVLLMATAPQARAQTPPPPGFRGEFLQQFNTSMSKFVALAEAMPADKYAWSPGPGVATVAHVYVHVARYNYNYPEMSMGIPAPDGLSADSLENTITTKAEAVAFLRRSREHVRTVLGTLTDEQLARPTDLYGRQVPQWAVLFQLVAHMNEHLGQSIAYARVNGVTPPWSQ